MLLSFLQRYRPVSYQPLCQISRNGLVSSLGPVHVVFLVRTTLDHGFQGWAQVIVIQVQLRGQLLCQSLWLIQVKLPRIG